MTKIAFYLQNENIKSVDCSDVLSGNPGIGGSEYAAILLSLILSQRKNNLDVVLYAHDVSKLPESLFAVKVSSLEIAVYLAIDSGVDVLIVDYKYLQSNLVTKFAHCMKFIVWAHNFVAWKDYNFYCKQENIIRVIHVGKEQMELYLDHPIFSKSDFIYNPFVLTPLEIEAAKEIPNSTRGNNVIYIGSLVEEKGFLYLAKAWGKVLEFYPDAQLYVVGSGKLYNRESKLGGFGIAEEQFEKRFMKYLSSQGAVLSSVHFMGIMGVEKSKLLQQCKVGVPNPSGNSETFGYTALEMQALGCNVVTKRCPGYFDTVQNKSNLYNHPRYLASAIIKALGSLENSSDLSLEFVEANFAEQVVAERWESLFKDAIPNNRKLRDEFVLTNKWFRLKYVKYLLRKIKDKNSNLDIAFCVEKAIAYVEKPKYYWMKFERRISSLLDF